MLSREHQWENSLELQQASYQHLGIPVGKRSSTFKDSDFHVKSDKLKFFDFIFNWYKLLGEGNLVEGIEVLSPFGKFPIRGFSLDISVAAQDVWLSPDGSEVNSSEKAYLLSLHSIDSVNKKEVMRKIFSYFFDPEWRKDSELALNEEFIGTDYSVKQDSKQLVFLRKYRGNYYYLKLRFNSGIPGEAIHFDSLN